MKVKDCKVGVRVLYRPVIGSQERGFLGTVREDPWQLGSGEWVTHLTNMEPAYGERVGLPGRKHVHAALVEHALELA